MDFVTQLEAKLSSLKEQYEHISMWPELVIGGKTARVPIIQGGMGVGISLSNLAAAAAEEGGIGVIAANAIGMIRDDYYENPTRANIEALRSEIRKARKKTRGLLGVNIMVAVDCFHQLLETAVEEKIDFLFLGAGLPIKNIPVSAIRAAGTQVVPIVSSARAARIIFKSWEKNYNDLPDAVVVEGPKAGGHLGFKAEQIDNPSFSLEMILPEVVTVMEEFETRWDRRIPVIAAGGIFTGEDIQKMLKLGARGVQLGSRFVATHECDADIRFKQAYIDCSCSDITIIESPVGLPGRAIRNRFLDDVASGVRKSFRCPSRCLESCNIKEARYCISEALNNARKGLLEEGFAFCGSNAHRINGIVSVRELITTLKYGYMVAVVGNSLKNARDKLIEKMKGMKEEYTAAVTKAALLMKEADSSAHRLLHDHEWSQTLKQTFERIIPLQQECQSILRKIEGIQRSLSELFEHQPDLQPA